MLAIVLVLLLHRGCPQPPPTFDQVLQAFERATDASQQQPATKKMGTDFPRQSRVQDADIYVNLGQTMRGFVDVSHANSRISPNSNYRRVLETLLDRMSTQGYRIRKYKFSSHSAVDDKAVFLDAAQYADGPVPLAQILTQLRTPSFDASRLSIIISDMIGAGTASGKEGQDPAACFRELQSHDPHLKVLLLGFRSAFEGRYRASAMACLNHEFQMAANQSLPGSGRPFYILVVAPNGESLKDLRRRVLDKLQGRVLFDPFSNPIPLERGEAPLQPNIKLFEFTTREEDSDLTRRLYSQLTVHQETQLRFEWSTTTDVDDDPSNLRLIDPSKVEAKVDIVSFTNRNSPTPAEPAQLPFSSSRDDQSGKLFFEYVVRPPESRGWVVYRVRVFAGSGNLQPARRTVAWTTDDDCTRARVRNTYKIDLLGEALSSSFSQDSVFVEHYIAIRRY